MPWTQNYDPLHGLWLSTLAAALPVLLLLGLLASGRVSAAGSALAGLTAAVVVAVLVFRPPELAHPDSPRLAGWATTALASAGYGAAFGLFPIGWIVFSAILLYNLTVDSGHFETVKRSVLALSEDRRIQALLIAFCFGAFVEGAAGFGTPVAISAALLLGAGFRPLHAAGLALLANTSPVAFGALGTPIMTLAKVTLPAGAELGPWEMRLSQMAGRQLPFFSLVVPAWLVWVMAGWRGVVGVWPALAVCGGSFALVQFLVANYHGPWLVDVAGGLISLVCLALFLRVWQPRRTWHFPHERAEEVPPHPQPLSPEGRGETEGRGAALAPLSPASGERGGGEGAFQQASAPHPRPLSHKGRGEEEGTPAPHPAQGLTTRAVLSAWVPWLLLTAFVFAWGLPWVKKQLAPLGVRVEVPALHGAVVRTPPVVPRRQAEDAVYEFNFLAGTGTGIFLAAVASALWLRVGVRRFLRTLGVTAYRLRWPLLTIACMLAIAFTTRYGGLDATLGLAFTRTGAVYPLFAALLGWLGVALTGSDTSSNALFGGLQTITAGRLVADGVLPLSAEQAKVLLACANSTGGVMGKMIDAQSIVVSAAATQQPGQEGPILRFVFGHSLALAVLMGLLVMAQAYVWTGAIP